MQVVGLRSWLLTWLSLPASRAFVVGPSSSGSVGSQRLITFQRSATQLAATKDSTTWNAASNDTAATLPLPSEASALTSLPHAYIARETRPDFEILATNPFGDSQDNLHDDSAEPQPLVYLDSAATSQKPQSVLTTLQTYYTQSNANVHRGAHALSRKATDAYEAARSKVASFLNAASRNEIVFTSGATEAINLVAQSYGRAFLQEQDVVLLTEAEHHANLVPWQILAQERNIELQFVRVDVDHGGLNMQHLESLLQHYGDRIRFVSFQHVSNVLGCVHPVERMVESVRREAPHAQILLDACQSVPHMPVDVQALGVDFLVASGHKMCGPTGIGFLWGREELLNQMPPYQGGGEMIDRVTLQGSTWQLAPARFEAGTPPIAQAIGLGAAIDYLQKVGMEKIEQYEHELAEYLFDRLSQVNGIRVLGPQVGRDRIALCAFVHESIHSSDLSSFLDMEGVAVRAGHHCCQPLHQAYGYSHSARASLYFYNTKEEIDLFIDKLQSTIEFFKGLESPGSVAAADDGDEFVPFV